jgi:glucokinase
VDVGGTTIKGGAIDHSGQTLGAASLPTEASLGQDHGLAQICEVVRRATASAGLAREQIAAIGVATPGTMDIPAGIILEPPNLRPWRNVPVREVVHEAFGIPTAFQNDANAAAYGEYWLGAGRGMRSLVMFTLGTGIGGGIVVDDELLEGRHSHGAEVGHTRIELSQPRPCPCGRVGCLEAYASATAVVKRTREMLDAGAPSCLHGSPASPESLTARDIFRAAETGDFLAERIVEDTAFYLAIGAINMMHTIDPDMIVFGGGMIAAGESLLGRIRRHIQALAFPIPAQKTEIRFALLGGDAGFIGAAACARKLHLRVGRSPRSM